jgi:hypothetical protein
MECGSLGLLLTRIVESWFGFVAERRPRVAVGFSPRWRTQRIGVAERRLNGGQMRPLKRRSATRILVSGNLPSSSRSATPVASDPCKEQSLGELRRNIFVTFAIAEIHKTW